MLFFELSKEKVKDIVTHFAKTYLLEDDIVNHIRKNIDEYTNIINVKVKNELIEDNAPSDLVNVNLNKVRYFLMLI